MEGKKCRSGVLAGGSLSKKDCRIDRLGRIVAGCEHCRSVASCDRGSATRLAARLLDGDTNQSASGSRVVQPELESCSSSFVRNKVIRRVEDREKWRKTRSRGEWYPTGNWDYKKIHVSAPVQQADVLPLHTRLRRATSAVLNGLRDRRPVTRGGEERREEERKKGKTRIKKGRNAKDERGENRLVKGVIATREVVQSPVSPLIDEDSCSHPSATFSNSERAAQIQKPGGGTRCAQNVSGGILRFDLERSNAVHQASAQLLALIGRASRENRGSGQLAPSDKEGLDQRLINTYIHAHWPSQRVAVKAGAAFLPQKKYPLLTDIDDGQTRTTDEPVNERKNEVCGGFRRSQQFTHKNLQAHLGLQISQNISPVPLPRRKGKQTRKHNFGSLIETGAIGPQGVRRQERLIKEREVQKMQKTEARKARKKCCFE
ncbi:hypothetical protein WN51_07484 [Melipona quadrifasciata]|uniref:Uncharacterized protein n=1 Tax=Melipona quadrifasciata TaxID=166423 RepID=A0A0M9A9E0_9HYME|nr:hypothetical protein WN51_07484 [Melipona quadrifasciata]